jgi:hypothetical protein
MKKKAFMGIMLLVAAMIFSASGTCFAQDTKIVDPTLSGTSRLFYGPVFSWAAADNQRGIGSGATCYGILADPIDDFAAKGEALAGATPFAIARDILDAGLNMNLVWAPDALGVDFSGATPLGSPAVISGETSAFVVAVQSDPAFGQVQNFAGINNGSTGVTIMLIDGHTMTANWKRGLPTNSAALGAGVAGPRAWDGTAAAANGGPHYPTELTIWTPNETLDATGATIYGTVGADLLVAASSGASVWSLTNWGAYAANGTGTTVWPNVASYSFTGSNQVIAVNGGGIASVSAIEGFITAPVISGDSIFYIGYAGAVNSAEAAALNGSGITIYQLDKDALGAVGATEGGVINMAPFKVDNVAQAWSDRFMPTPVASGGSLFVVGNQGGVTVYDTQDLVWGGTRTAGYIGNILLPQGVFTGVTASPVVLETGQADPYIIMCGTSAVTCWNISDGLASNQRQWWYDFAANIGVNSQIWGTPAVADGYVFVPVADFIGSDGAIYAFDIDGTPDLANGQLQWAEQYNLNSEAVASPILINRELWAFSFGTAAANNARVTQWDVSNLISDDYSAQNYWTQFKFDAAKTGDGTKIDDDDDYVEGSSGCFLSTVR